MLALTQFLMTVDASVMNVSIGALVEDFDTTVTVIGAVVIASLGALFLRGIEQSAVLEPALKEQAAVEISSGVEFVSVAQVENAKADRDTGRVQNGYVSPGTGGHAGPLLER